MDKIVFSARIIQRSHLVERLKGFVEAQKILSKDPELLKLAHDYKIIFLKIVTEPQHLNYKQKQLVHVEVNNMFEQGVIFQINYTLIEFFDLLKKPNKNGRIHPVISLENLNQFLPCQHFKMESTFGHRELLLTGYYLCKLDMKETYFSVSLYQSSKKYTCFFHGEETSMRFCAYVLGEAQSQEFSSNY